LNVKINVTSEMESVIKSESVKLTSVSRLIYIMTENGDVIDEKKQ